MVRVLAAGTFDFLHPGHITFLKKAKSLGDELYVIISSDEGVKRLGKRPFNPAVDRAEMLSQLRFVDRVVIGDPKDPVKTVELIKPDVIFLGYDQRLPQGLEEYVKTKGIRVERDQTGYHPDYYKSTLAKLSILSEISHLLAVSYLVEKNVNHCPWTAKKNCRDFITSLEDELEEVKVEIESGCKEGITEELGDVLWNVLNVIYLCSRDGLVNIDRVYKGILDKIMRRKPFLIDGRKITSEEAVRLWKEAKEFEKNNR